MTIILLDFLINIKGSGQLYCTENIRNNKIRNNSADLGSRSGTLCGTSILKAVRLEYQLLAGEGEAAVGEGYCHYDPVSIGGASDLAALRNRMLH